jgi:alpha-tubulin suppressor-like RCC1 family protein
LICTQHSFVLCEWGYDNIEKGEIYSWGGNWAGQLGHGDLQNQPTPKVIDMSQSDTPTADLFFSKVYGGRECSAAISS